MAQLVSQNLRFFMNRRKPKPWTANELAVKSEIAPNTVRNFLDPHKRTVTTEKMRGSPTLDKLQALAKTLECEAWELLHPDIERAISEREMYAKLEADFNRIKSTAKVKTGSATVK